MVRLIGYARHVIRIGFWFHSIIMSRFLPHPPFVEICTYCRIVKSIRASIGICTFNNYLQYRTCEELHPVNHRVPPSSWPGSWCPTTMKQSFWLYEWEAPLSVLTRRKAHVLQDAMATHEFIRVSVFRLARQEASGVAYLHFLSVSGARKRWAFGVATWRQMGTDEKQEELKVLLVLIV